MHLRIYIYINTHIEYFVKRVYRFITTPNPIIRHFMQFLSFLQFATLLLTILIIQVAVAIFSFVVLKGADDISFKDMYIKSFFSRYRPEYPDDIAIVDTIQQEVSLLS